MNELDSKHLPDVFILTDYTKTIYKKLIDYAEIFGNKPKGTDTVTFVNEIITFVFKHNHKSLLILMENKKENGFTALHFYFLKLIKNGLPVSGDH